MGRVEGCRQDGDATLITYHAPEHVLDSVIERGPICVDGVSLTAVAKDERTFAVSIVGFTGAHTTLLDKAIGDPVNLESDIMMRYVQQAVKSRRSRASQAPGRLHR